MMQSKRFLWRLVPTLALRVAWQSKVTIDQTGADPSSSSNAGSGGDGGQSAMVTSGAGGSETSPGSACAEMVGAGYSIGDIATNWKLPNAVGQMIELYDLCGKVIFFEEGSMW